MFARRTDIQFGNDALGGFLPWLIALMVFLAIMAVAGADALHQVAERWDQGGNATLTVQVPAGADATEDDRRIAAAVATLAAMPGITDVRPVTAAEVSLLLAPWLGSATDSLELPLPRLIDVTLSDDSNIDARAVQSSLSDTLPGVAVDDHRVWLSRVVSLLRAAEALAFAVLGMIAIACAGTVVFTTRTGLAVHQEAIEVMHLIGARDSYIAQQFAQRALGLGLRGGILGAILALPVLLATYFLGEQLPEGMLPDLTVEFWRLALLAMPPLAAAVIATLTARLTVMRTLGRMP